MPRRKSPTPVAQTESLAIILFDEFGVTFEYYDATTGNMVEGSGLKASRDLLSSCKPEQIKQWAMVGTAQVNLLAQHQFQLALPLRISHDTFLVVVGNVKGFARSQAEAALEQVRLQKWSQSVCDRLTMANAAPVQHRKPSEQNGNGSLAWRAIVALDQLAGRLRVHKDNEKHQKRILGAIADLVRMQAVVWVPQQADADIIEWGESGMASSDCRQLAHRLNKSTELGKLGFLLVNDVQNSSWGSCFPQINNILALTIRHQRSLGLLFAVNKHQAASALKPTVGQDDDSSPSSSVKFRQDSCIAEPLNRSDILAITPFASLLGLHVTTSSHFHELKNLLVGLARSLTSAIDAKDAYTYGHSERVGRIAVELGRELGLAADELSDLYLAGLLHDIGKIGIREAVLLKPTSLTTEEKVHLQQHVTIGHNILIELHHIRHLLPGVLYHHERYDGGGYPEGLKGESIPFIARILAVADAYDAMSTSRPYRELMPAEQIESILRAGAGSQWDKNVIDAFFRCSAKIYLIRQRGIGDSLRQAVHGVFREGDSDQSVSST